MTLRLKGSNSGDVSLKAPATAGDNTITLPTSNGSAEQFLKNSGTAGELEFSSMVEDSSGRVLIGHSSNYADSGADDLVVGSTGNSEQGITIGASTSSQIRFADAGANTAGYILYNHSDDALAFSANGTERARIDSSGRLLVGTTSVSHNSRAVIAGRSDANAAGTLVLESTSSSPGNGDTLGNFRYGTSGNTGSLAAAAIGAERDGGTWTNNSSMPARLVFSTTGNGESSPTERLRLGNSGEFTLRPATYGMGVRSVAGSSSVNTAYFGAHSATSMTAGTITFEVYTNGNVKNTNNSYGQLSDERLKENIINAPSQWDDIKSLQIRKYNFRDGNGYDTHTQIGLVAQEVEAVSPGLVQETPVREDATPVLDAEGNELEATKSVLTSVVYMKALKALQEAQTRIETLETQNTAQQTQIDDLLARVTALEAA